MLKIRNYKNKKIDRYKKYFLIFFGIILIFGTFFYVFEKYYDKKIYILKINDEKISKNEFILYLYEQKKYFEGIGGTDIWQTPFDLMDAKDVAKNNAVKTITLLKTAIKQSKSLNINLNEEETQNIEKEAIILKDTIEKEYNSYNIPLKIYKKFIKENLLEYKIFSYLTDGFRVNENDFQNYFKEYIKKNNRALNEVLLDYIFLKKDATSNSKNTIKDIESKINKNSDFSQFNSIPSLKIEKDIKLENGVFESYIEDLIYTLDEGSISSIIEGSEGYYIFKIKKIAPINIKEVENNLRETYISDKKNELYYSQINPNAKIEKNNELFNTINIPERIGGE